MKRAVLLVDHGSRRPEANAQLEALAERVRERLPDRYVAATPSDAVSGRLLIVHGDDDGIVLRQWTGGSPAFEAALVALAGTDHFDVIDPSHRSWELVVDEIEQTIG